jgi:hypothetical protein
MRFFDIKNNDGWDDNEELIEDEARFANTHASRNQSNEE